MYLETTQPERRAVARTTLRRAIPSFTVEVRRRPRLATTSNPDVQSSETRPPQAAFDRESSHAAAAAFGSKQVDQSRVDVAASHPRGRILPSLVHDEPRHRLLEDAAADSELPSRASKRLSVRTSKRKDQASKLPRNSSFSADENAPLAERSSTKSHRTSGVQSGEGAGASTSATTAPTQVAGGPALLAKAKRREKLPTSRDDFRAKPLPDDQASAMGTDSPATLPSRRDAQSPEGRKRTIMARYVFGNELKPGERWKRRLRPSR
jgi:hypothetical protein